MEKKTHQGGLKKRLRIFPTFGDDIILLVLDTVIQSEPNATEIEFLHETLADVAELGLGAPSLQGTEAWPVAVIKKYFNARFLGEFARNDVEHYDARFCERYLVGLVAETLIRNGKHIR